MERLTRRRFLRYAALSLAAMPTLANRPLTDLFKEGALPPTAKPKRRFAPLEEEVGRVMAEHHMPGLQVGLIRANQLVYARGFGVRDIRTGAPMTEKTVILEQSMSKAFTGAAVMQLVERGKVNIDHLYLDYVPYFTMEDPRYKQITIRHLMGHTSGLPFCLEGGFFEEFMTPSYGPDASRLAVLSLAAKGVPFLQDPGDPGFFYSDIGFDLLAELVHLVSGELFEDYVRRHMLDPLHMKDSTMLYPQVDKRTLAAPHIYDSAGNIVVWDHFPWDRKHTPSSGLFSNVLDFSQWLLMYMNGGAWRGGRILQPASHAFLWEALSALPPEWGAGYGYNSGWFMGKEGDRLWKFTGGGGPGTQTVALVSPREGLATMAFSNLNDISSYFDGYWPGELCFWALQQMLDGVF